MQSLGCPAPSRAGEGISQCRNPWAKSLFQSRDAPGSVGRLPVVSGHPQLCFGVGRAAAIPPPPPKTAALKSCQGQKSPWKGKRRGMGRGGREDFGKGSASHSRLLASALRQPVRRWGRNLPRPPAPRPGVGGFNPKGEGTPGMLPGYPWGCAAGGGRGAASPPGRSALRLPEECKSRAWKKQDAAGIRVPRHGFPSAPQRSRPPRSAAWDEHLGQRGDDVADTCFYFFNQTPFEGEGFTFRAAVPNASSNSGLLLLVIKLYIDLFLPLFLPLGFCIARVLFLFIKMKLYFKSVI